MFWFASETELLLTREKERIREPTKKTKKNKSKIASSKVIPKRHCWQIRSKIPTECDGSGKGGVAGVRRQPFNQDIFPILDVGQGDVARRVV